MKTKNILLMVILCNTLISTKLHSQGSWEQKANYPEGKTINPVGFSVGTKGYTGLGGYGPVRTSFYEYDQATDSWSQITDFPGAARSIATAFSINGKGYIGHGINDNQDVFSDFWAYDPNTDSWTKIADYPGGRRFHSTAFVVNGKAYVGTGDSLNNGVSATMDFYEYNPTTDSWTQIADFPGGERTGASSFGIGSLGYVGTGLTNQFKNDLWSYNPVTDIWTQVADFPGTARIDCQAFAIGGKGYLGVGYDFDQSSDFWEYNPSTDSWTEVAAFPSGRRDQGMNFVIGSKGYIGLGYDSTFTAIDDLWEFNPSDSTAGAYNIKAINHIVFYPNPATNRINIIGNYNQATIYNLLGQELLSIKNTNSVNIGSFKSGMYILSIDNKAYRFIKD